MRLEGSGKDPHSSAVGGFIDSTWLNLMHQTVPQSRQMPDDQVLAMRADPVLRGRMVAAYAAQNASTLQQAGIEPDETNLRLAHWFGAGGAARVLHADPSTPVNQIFPDTVIQANPVLHGKTAGELVSFTNQQMSGPDLRQTATGNFNPAAQDMLSQWRTDLAQRQKQYDTALHDAHDIGDAEMAALAKWRDSSDTPPKNAHEAWQQWSVPAMLLATFGGMIGHNFTASLNAAGTMLQAANTVDKDTYDKSYKLWRDHLSDGLKLATLLHEQARDIVTDASKSYDMKLTELSTLSSAYSLQQKLNPDSVENIQKNLEVLKLRSDLIKAQNLQTETDAAVAEKDQSWLAAHPEAAGKVPPDVHLMHEGEAKRMGAGTAARLPLPREVQITNKSGAVLQTGAAYQDQSGNWLWAATNAPISVPPGGIMNLKSTSQPRSAIAMATQKYVTEHPNASAADIAQFNAEYTRLAALDRDFASGPEGRNLIALTTTADHLPLFRQFAAALQNGNTPVANSLLNEIQRQTGHPEITDFNLARDFLADEVARVLVPGGAGSAADREQMKARLEASMSEAQLASGADTATAFIKGKLEALRQQYSRGDAARASYFDKSMLTGGARSLFEGSGTTAPGQHHVGEIITAPNGKRYRVTGGNMSDPNVEPVQ